MVTNVRVGALRLVIYPDDHEPPHVHVIGDSETKIELGDSPAMLKVIFSTRVRTSERRRAIEAVRENHALLLRRWSELNG